MNDISSKKLIHFLLDLFGSLVDSIPILLMSLSISTKVRRSNDGTNYAIFFKTSDDSLFKEFKTTFISVHKDKRAIKQFNNNEYCTIGVNKILKLYEYNTRYNSDLLHQYYHVAVPVNPKNHTRKRV
jgi:hypothetical protein